MYMCTYIHRLQYQQEKAFSQTNTTQALTCAPRRLARTLRKNVCAMREFSRENVRKMMKIRRFLTVKQVPKVPESEVEIDKRT